MSLAQPHYYWSEVRYATTSNSQWAVGDPQVAVTPALRANDDSYVRSIWSAQLTYFSPGTLTTYYWWGQAQVRLVIAEDPQALAFPSDVGDNDPLTLGYQQMSPRWSPTPGAGTTYQVTWDTAPDQLALRTGRSFVDAGHPPQIVAGLFASDQGGFFALSESGGKIIRVQITGRTLWASSVP